MRNVCLENTIQVWVPWKRNGLNLWIISGDAIPDRMGSYRHLKKIVPVSCIWNTERQMFGWSDVQSIISPYVGRENCCTWFELELNRSKMLNMADSEDFSVFFLWSSEIKSTERVGTISPTSVYTGVMLWSQSICS